MPAMPGGKPKGGGIGGNRPPGPVATGGGGGKRPAIAGGGGRTPGGFGTILPALNAAAIVFRHSDNVRQGSQKGKHTGGIDQILSLVLHPLLIIEFDILFVFSSITMSFSDRRLNNERF